MIKSVPGRSCPLHYRYPPSAFGGRATVKADSLYIVGGLYGNAFALDAVLDLARQEKAALVFNGDFNWFDIDSAGFEKINETVLRHTALRGNVETELSPVEPGIGCGCAYPEWVGEAEVGRSNQIMEMLRQTASTFPRLCTRLSALPAHLIAEVGEAKIGIVHGDAESLSGWSFSQERLRDDVGSARALISACAVDVFASSHTCLPVLQNIPGARKSVLIVNNGAAGMPNFEGTNFGIATRIAVTASQRALYGGRVGGTYVEAVPIRYDHKEWLAQFDRMWPENSPASLSYRKRILSGPTYHIADAARLHD